MICLKKMTKTFNDLLIEHSEKLASVYTNKNFSKLGLFQYVRKIYWVKNELFIPSADVWHTFFINNEMFYIHKDLVSKAFSKFDTTKYSFYNVDLLNSFALTNISESSKITLTEKFIGTQGFYEIPLKEFSGFDKTTMLEILFMEIFLHDAHYNFKLQQHMIEKDIISRDFSCNYHKLIFFSHILFPDFLRIYDYCRDSIMTHNLSCEKCTDTSKHQLIKKLSNEVKQTLVLTLWQLQRSTIIQFTYGQIQKQKEMYAFYLNDWDPKLFETFLENEHKKPEKEKSKKMTNNFNDLLIEHNEKLASVYTNKNFSKLGLFQYVKGNYWIIDEPFIPSADVWHTFFINNEILYIHKSLMSKVFSKFDTTKYAFYNVDLLNSFALTNISESSKITLTEKLTEAQGFYEIPLKEFSGFDKKNMLKILVMEMFLHDAHYNFKLREHLAEKHILAEAFSCQFHNLIMFSQILFPDLLQFYDYCCHTIMTHNLSCEECTDTSKHQLIKHIPKEINQLLVQSLELLLEHLQQGNPTPFTSDQIQKQKEMFNIYFNDWDSKLFEIFLENEHKETENKK